MAGDRIRFERDERFGLRGNDSHSVIRHRVAGLDLRRVDVSVYLGAQFCSARHRDPHWPSVLDWLYAQFDTCFAETGEFIEPFAARTAADLLPDDSGSFFRRTNAGAAQKGHCPIRSFFVCYDYRIF